MKKNIYLIFITVSIFSLISCEKNGFNITSVDEVGNNAQLKINFFSMYRSVSGLQIKINDVRVSNTLAQATPFPGGGLNTGGGSTADYLSVMAGDNKIAISIPKVLTNIDSITLASITASGLTGGKKYSLFFADTATNLKSLLVEDSLSVPDSGFAKFKFINLMPDLPSADLYIGTIKVASAISYLSVSPSFTVPTNSVSTTWAIRAANALPTSTALFTYASGTTLGNQRLYTVFTRGYNSITSTTDPRIRRISFVFNK